MNQPARCEWCGHDGQDLVDGEHPACTVARAEYSRKACQKIVDSLTTEWQKIKKWQTACLIKNAPPEVVMRHELQQSYARLKTPGE